MADCPHLNIMAHVHNLRVTEIAGQPALHWIAAVVVKCAQCGCPFQFLGLPTGMSVDTPAAAPGARIAHLPMVPAPHDETPVN